MTRAGAAARVLGTLVGAAALLLAAPPPVARAELSVVDYLGIRDGADKERKANLPLYLAGVLEGLLTFNELNASMGVQVICVPSGANIDLATFRGDVDKAIERTRAEQSDFVAYAEQANISVMGLAALNERFPCSGDEGQPSEGEPGRR